jgi:decaprenylphospho-beta-D-erythro-pentofuranosid-2-ulose 2-reductase
VIDSLGAPQSVLVLGATSDIATAVVNRFAAGGRLERAVLAGRDHVRTEAEAGRVRGLGVADVRAVRVEASDLHCVRTVIHDAFDAGDIDVVLLAIGALPDQPEALADPDLAVASWQVNFVGAASAALYAAQRLRRQGHGVLVALSSVAAERPRRSNFVYGAGKGGLDALCSGLADHLHGTGVSVLVVRPGFVRTSMTRGLPEPPLAVEPEAVADAIARHLGSGSATLWVPSALRPLMSVVRHLPRPVFRRLPW